MTWLDDPSERAFRHRSPYEVDPDGLLGFLKDVREKIIDLMEGQDQLRHHIVVMREQIDSLTQARRKQEMFIDWMKAVHPSVIEAYTKSTEVAQRMEEK